MYKKDNSNPGSNIAEKLKERGVVFEDDTAIEYASVNSEKLADTVKYLKQQGYDHLSFLTAIDKKGSYNVVYNLYSYSMRDEIALKVNLGDTGDGDKKIMVSPSDVESLSEEINKCVGCKLCNKQCPQEIDVKTVIFDLKNGKEIDPGLISECVKCNLCAEKCPKKVDILKVFEAIDAANKIALEKNAGSGDESKAYTGHEESEQDFSVQSISELYESANWHERETSEMFGINFENHPNPRNLLLPDTFIGHPLRKSYDLSKEQRVDMDSDFEFNKDYVNVDDFIAEQSKKGKHYNTRVMHINMGPQHPATHGVLRLRILVDGEHVIKMYPVLGYLHRGMEKIAENLNYWQFIPYLDRLDYVASMLNEFPYVLTVEKLMGLEVPDRAQYLRVITAELSRIASHLMWVATWPMDLGALTPFFYCFREREQVLEIFEDLCGARMMFNYMKIGGVKGDVNDKIIEDIYKFVDEMPSHLDEYHELLTENEILLGRTKGVGVMDKDTAVAHGVSGPLLRACGFEYDIRKAHPYSMYDKFKFKVPTYNRGDCYDRYLVRMDEIAESVKIVKQAVDSLPEGDIIARVPRVITPPAGSCYTRIEHAKGEMGIYVVSDGKPKPYRLKIRSPAYSNLSVLPHLCEGEKIADVVTISGTIDPVMGCVDR